MHRVAGDDPQRRRLAAAAVLLVRVGAREPLVGRDHRAGVLERLPLALLPEDLVDRHVRRAPASTTDRTHSVSWRDERGGSSSRSAVSGPCPVTTARSSSQSGSVYSQTPSSRLRSFGSGTVRPSSQICGT